MDALLHTEGLFLFFHLHASFSVDLFLICCLAKLYRFALRSLQTASGLSGMDQYLQEEIPKCLHVLGSEIWDSASRHNACTVVPLCLKLHCLFFTWGSWRQKFDSETFHPLSVTEILGRIVHLTDHWYIS